MQLLLLVVAFAIVVLGAVFAATIMLNKMADKADR
jgi:hypothetical protein